MSPITTHVLDVSLGRPAAGIPVLLEMQEEGGWAVMGRGVTDADGRHKTLMEPGTLAAGVYRLTFDTAAYFKLTGAPGFFPTVPVVFELRAPGGHHHVPLLLSPYGYSTYRGS